LGHTPQSIKYRLGMELKSRAKISGPSAKPRATSLGREVAADREEKYCVANTTIVSLPSSPTTTTWDGKFSSHTPPVQGGQTRTSIRSARSESAGGSIRLPEGSPPRRQAETSEHGDMNEATTCVWKSSAAAALVGGPMAKA